MLHRLALAAALALAALSMPAEAQVPRVVASCGSSSIPVGPGGYQTVDTAGNLCTNAGSPGNGGATAANQQQEINALGAPADTAYGGAGNASIVAALKGLYAGTVTRSITYNEFTGLAVPASSNSVATARPSSPAYTKFNATAGCDASGAFLVVRGSNDNFATSIAIASPVVPASTRNSFTPGASVSAPVTMAAYHAFIFNGSNANVCNLVTSYTVN